MGYRVSFMFSISLSISFFLRFLSSSNTAVVISSSQSNGFKLAEFTFRREIGRNWYGNRVVDEWNELPGEILRKNRVDTFKTNLDRYMDNQGWI